MTVNDPDAFCVFQDVRVLRSTAPALLCRIGSKRVWLPRRHIAGNLWCTGDRGKLSIRRWVALDRQLIHPPGTFAVLSLVRSPSRRRLPPLLHLVRGDRAREMATH